MINDLRVLKNQLLKSRQISICLLSGMKDDLRVRTKAVQLVEKSILMLLLSSKEVWKSEYEFMIDLIIYINRKLVKLKL
ncbi:hypothetical protein GMA43_11910 [Turicibacter sanguinis]|uniref:hypothetical protein n=1 Tax=Erysipelotrichales TaxID=526525 RepID=UPI0012B87DA1|nr:MULTISPECIES: hypothetical protein [unclassified Turicibacter]MTH07934.1 hypothetical protein [Turicibacter sanguinis]MCU7194816.1 hypothetical protein [Turicibacter sp. T129]MCU7206338.1 hypothetical protein [Turicibacter sp. GALT-G1]MTH10891.1 hypothetical protein [Turicibacter sanguinis]MTH13672.1 hypothetical protein [Turicibacter sanguinis]